MAADSPPTIELCVGAVVIDDGRLLLVRRGHGPAAGSWSVPGGRVDPGETVGEAVLRELAEETGLEGFCGDLIGWVELIGADHHFVVLDFAVTCLDPPDPTAGDDAVEASWIPLEVVGELPLADGLAEFLAEHDIIDTVL